MIVRRVSAASSIRPLAKWADASSSISAAAVASSNCRVSCRAWAIDAGSPPRLRSNWRMSAACFSSASPAADGVATGFVAAACSTSSPPPARRPAAMAAAHATPVINLAAQRRGASAPRALALRSTENSKASMPRLQKGPGGRFYCRSAADPRPAFAPAAPVVAVVLATCGPGRRPAFLS
jgi:hypothetical protein